MENLKYIAHWSNGQKLCFDLFNNELNKIWIQTLNNKLITDCDETTLSFPRQVNSDNIIKRLIKNIWKLKIIFPDLYLPTEINQKNLNYIHEIFHTNIENSTYTEYNKLFFDINYDIHTIEKILSNNENYTNWKVISYEYNESSRYYINDELKKKYWKPIKLSPFKRCTLVLGYDTAGKNLEHCVIDNDINLVKNNLVRPQKTIGGEHYIVYKTGKDWEEINNNPDYVYNKYLNDLENFMDKNNLYNFIDHKNVNHTHCTQPILGVVSSEFNHWTESDYYNLFSNNQLVKIEVKL